jgi:hypothetical protein
MSGVLGEAACVEKEVFADVFSVDGLVFPWGHASCVPEWCGGFTVAAGCGTLAGSTPGAG